MQPQIRNSCTGRQPRKEPTSTPKLKPSKIKVRKDKPRHPRHTRTTLIMLNAYRVIKEEGFTSEVEAAYFYICSFVSPSTPAHVRLAAAAILLAGHKYCAPDELEKGTSIARRCLFWENDHHCLPDASEIISRRNQLLIVAEQYVKYYNLT